ncbi:DNA-binding domain-containing protein [Halomonas koreensis]|uniref:DNA-binding domain-containing protein n=1 Tax=Halomonas koreensis TaxID=245385 RepID=A0ABU1FYV8_9GAMM|nr:DNA-binding domain-containing protein [Halomonas koreensis]MDR5865548.1 DNA-binding domain-containing protein [Halomonas koreensis]
MSPLADWQRRFIAAMHEPGIETDADLGQPAGLDVYRNNIRQGLIEALATAFPHTRTLLGPRYFAAAAGDYARAHPPADPRLMHYGHGFADFLDTLPPLEAHRYVSDVCRLERARLDVSHAAEAPALTAPQLAGHPAPEALVPAPRPATRLVACRHDVAALWRRLEAGGAALPPGEAGDRPWLAVRRDGRARLTPVAPGVRHLYGLLDGATTLGEALAIAAEAGDEAAAGEALGTLLGLGALGVPGKPSTEDIP